MSDQPRRRGLAVQYRCRSSRRRRRLTGVGSAVIWRAEIVFMRAHGHLAVGYIFMVAWLTVSGSDALAGEKIEITPVSPASKANVAPSTPRGPSKLDLQLDKLEGARIQTIQPSGPGMSIPAPEQRPAEDNKKRNWLMDSAGGNKPLDYNGALGVRDYSDKARRGASGSALDFDERAISPSRNLPSGRNDFGRSDASRRDFSGRGADSFPGLNGLPSTANSSADALGGLRDSSPLNSLPNLPRSSDRDLEQMRSRSALRSEVDGILSGTDSRFRDPLATSLSVENILRQPDGPGFVSPRARTDVSLPVQRTVSSDPLGAPVLKRDLAPGAAFNKQSADALSAQRPKLAEPERQKDELRNRPSVLPFPKRGF